MRVGVWKSSGVRSSYTESLQSGGPGETRPYCFDSSDLDTGKPRPAWVSLTKHELLARCSQIHLTTFRDMNEPVGVWNSVWSVPVLVTGICSAPTSATFTPNFINHSTQNLNSNGTHIRGDAMQLITVTIPNWEQYNARTDRANYTWFRFQNGLFQSQKLFGLTDSQLLLFVFCLCEVSKKNSGSAEINAEYVSTIRKTTEQQILKDFQELEKRGVITTAGGHQMVEQLPATNVRTYDTNERTIRTLPKNPTVSGEKAKAFIAAYCELFKNRWGNNPPITGKDAGIAKRLVKELSEEKLSLYLDAYFSMPDAWVIKTKHTLASFSLKINEVAVFATSGEFTTNRDARMTDDRAASIAQLARIRSGELGGGV